MSVCATICSVAKLCHTKDAGMHKRRELLLDTCHGSNIGMDTGMTDICCAYRAHTSAASTNTGNCVESTGSHAVPAGVALAYCQHDPWWPLIANMHQHTTCTAFDGLTLKQFVIEC